MATSFTEEMFNTDSRWPSFSFGELKCSHTGACVMDEAFLDRLQALRNEVGPLLVSSGYRSVVHPVEVGKGKPGTHTMGRAVDIVCRGEKALDVLRFSLQLGFTGIGVKQHGKEGRFLHLDDLTSDAYHGPRPTVWSY